MKSNMIPDYNKSRSLKPPKFRVNYYIDNDQIGVETFVTDTHAYDEGETVIIKEYTLKHVTHDGNWIYFFVGWSIVPGSNVAQVNPGDEFIVAGDIHLYAVWSKERTYNITLGDNDLVYISLKDNINGVNYIPHIQRFVIPEYFGGVRIKAIGSNCFSNTHIPEIVIPPSITLIEADAFNGWTGYHLRFIEQSKTTKYPYVTIQHGAFYNTPHMEELILPYRLETIIPVGGGSVTGGSLLDNTLAKEMKVLIRLPKDHLAEKLGVDEIYLDGIISQTEDILNGYTVNIIWGYND